VQKVGLRTSLTGSIGNLLEWYDLKNSRTARGRKATLAPTRASRLAPFRAAQ
jgi:hypothetical protein